MSTIAPEAAGVCPPNPTGGAPQRDNRRAKANRSWNPIKRYTRWLHTMWPAGTVERLPEVQPDGSTNIPGVYVVGDLTGIPLLKFSADTGTRAVMAIVNHLAPGMPGDTSDGALDILII